MEKRTAPDAHIVGLDPDHGSFITAVWGAKQYSIRSEDDGFQNALKALKSQNWDGLFMAMNPGEAFVVTYQKEDVAIVNGEVVYKGEVVHNTVTKRILQALKEGLPCDHLLLFLSKCMKNPSRDSVLELYTFLEQLHIPICTNGNFLAYKGLQSDFYSISSGKAKVMKGKVNAKGQIYNGVGETIEVTRTEVDADRNRGCSFGLHAGTYEYANGFRNPDGKLVICEISPEDVVSVPVDCNFAKLRSRKYTVIAECDKPIVQGVAKTDSSPISNKYAIRGSDGKFAKHSDKIAVVQTPTANKHSVRGSDGKFASRNTVTQAAGIKNKIATAANGKRYFTNRGKSGRFGS